MSQSNNSVRESLSALMDGEVNELETRRVVHTLSVDAQLRDSWHRYHLASQAMRRELPAQLVDFSSQISAAIEAEKLSTGTVKKFLSPIGRVAIAASVAVVAIVASQHLYFNAVTAELGDNALATAGNGVSGDYRPEYQLPAGFQAPIVSARNVSTGSVANTHQPRTLLVINQPRPDALTEQQIEQYLNQMMQAHTEQASLNSSQGMLPFARLPQQQDGR